LRLQKPTSKETVARINFVAIKDDGIDLLIGDEGPARETNFPQRPNAADEH
jgi:hypothetical protein